VLRAPRVGREYYVEAWTPLSPAGTEDANACSDKTELQIMRPARPSSQRNLLCRSSRPQARRPKSRFQRGSSVEPLLRHQDPEPRRLPERDWSTAAPPTTDDHTNLRQGRYEGAAHHCHAVDGRCVMSALRTAFHDHLAVCRALGYKLRLEGRPLSRSVDFAERSDVEYITTALALNWAAQCTTNSMGQSTGDGASVCAILPPQRPAHRGAAA
jgi:hypothetical protein